MSPEDTGETALCYSIGWITGKDDEKKEIYMWSSVGFLGDDTSTAYDTTIPIGAIEWIRQYPKNWHSKPRKEQPLNPQFDVR